MNIGLNVSGEARIRACSQDESRRDVRVLDASQHIDLVLATWQIGIRSKSNATGKFQSLDDGLFDHGVCNSLPRNVGIVHCSEAAVHDRPNWVESGH
jgi:hypothetical protein